MLLCIMIIPVNPVRCEKMESEIVRDEIGKWYINAKSMSLLNMLCDIEYFDDIRLFDNGKMEIHFDMSFIYTSLIEKINEELKVFDRMIEKIVYDDIEKQIVLVCGLSEE